MGNNHIFILPCGKLADEQVFVHRKIRAEYNTLEENVEGTKVPRP
jgi:hypothetical protein